MNMLELDRENITYEDLMALVIGLLLNTNLRVYDNGLTIAENVLNNLDLK